MNNHPEAERIPLDAQHPWPSLHAFTRDQHAHFRGRDEEIEELVRCLRRRILTVVFGLSGLGKTSLLQAGVFPALARTEFVPILIRLDPTAVDIDLVEQIREEIRSAIQQENIRVPRGPEPDESLWSFFHRPELDWISPLGTRLNAVLVFDQFEEVFTRSQRDSQTDASRRHLFRELAALVENRPPDELQEQIEEDASLVERYDFSQQDYRVVISLREDYLPRLEELRKRMPSIMDNRFRLNRMNEQQALQAILQPGRDIIKESVAREVVAFIAGSSVASDNGDTQQIDPALLSLMCSELNNQRLQDHLPSITSELLSGRSDRILDDFYLRCFEFISEEKQPIARRLVEDRLLTGDKHRETLTVETFERELAENGLPPATVHKLVDKRLLQLDERHGLQRVELAHDILTKVVGDHRDRRKDLEAIEDLRRREQEERDATKQREEKTATEIRQLRKARNRYVVIGVVFALMFAGMVWLQVKNWRMRDELVVTKGTLEEARAARERAERTKPETGLALKTELENKQRALEKATALLVRIKQESVVKQNADLERQIREITGGIDTSEVEELRRKSRDLDRVGDKNRDDKNFKAAIDAYNESRMIREKCAAMDESNPELLFDVSSSHNDLGNVYFDSGDFGNALREFTDALAIRDRLISKNPDSQWQRGRFFSLLNISDVLQKLGKTDDAIQKAREAQGIASTLFKAEPANRTWKSDQKLAADQILRLQQERGR